jgi:hypothetical protein
VVPQLLAKLFHLFFDDSRRSFGHETLGIFLRSSFRAKRGFCVPDVSTGREISLGTRLQDEVPVFGWYYIE